MTHCDPEDLSLLALGEDVDVDREHLDSCSACTAELDALRSVVLSARSGSVEPVTPPPAVWAGIAAATGVRATPGGGAPPAAPPPPTPLRPRSAEHDRSAPRAGRWPTWMLAAAAVAGVLAGGGVAALVAGGQDAGPGTAVVAADLEPLVDAAEAGTAELVDSREGRLLRLTVAGLPADDGFHQVWLLDQQAQRMVPLGVLRGDTGEFVVPEGLDVAEYPVVDVSAEPYDGDPTHSGVSLLRGTLDA